jgi:hypothetical protein
MRALFQINWSSVLLDAVRWNGLNWINLAQHTDKIGALLNKVMNLQVPQDEEVKPIKAQLLKKGLFHGAASSPHNSSVQPALSGGRQFCLIAVRNLRVCVGVCVCVCVCVWAGITQPV